MALPRIVISSVRGRFSDSVFTNLTLEEGSRAKLLLKDDKARIRDDGGTMAIDLELFFDISDSENDQIAGNGDGNATVYTAKVSKWQESGGVTMYKARIDSEEFRAFWCEIDFFCVRYTASVE